MSSVVNRPYPTSLDPKDSCSTSSDVYSVLGARYLDGPLSTVEHEWVCPSRSVSGPDIPLKSRKTGDDKSVILRFLESIKVPSSGPKSPFLPIAGRRGRTGVSLRVYFTDNLDNWCKYLRDPRPCERSPCNRFESLEGSVHDRGRRHDYPGRIDP